MSFNIKSTASPWPALIAAMLVWAVPTANWAQTAPAATRAATPKFIEVPATTQLLNQLQAGGYTLYLRHGPTNNSIPDRVPAVDLKDCGTQRPLTEAGRALMAKVGQSMRQARIPIGEFRVSPLCRAKDSAAAAFPERTPEVDPLLMYVANFTANQKAPVVSHTRGLLSAPVAAGENRLLLAHAPNLMEIIGYFPKEGTLVIFRPKGDRSGFEYLASVAPDAWADLLK